MSISTEEKTLVKSCFFENLGVTKPVAPPPHPCRDSVAIDLESKVRFNLDNKYVS